MYEIGDPVTLTTLVKDSTGTPANAGSMNLAITLPDGTAGTVTNPVTGVAGAYSYVYTTTTSGSHIATWTATGANAGVYVDTFHVELEPQGMVSLSEVKAHLRITRTNDDEVLRSLILTASSLAEGPEGTGKVWRRRVITNEKHSGGGYSIPLNLRPVQSITAITIDGVAGVVADYDVEDWRITSTSGLAIGNSTRRSNVLVSYIVGTSSIPSPLRDAVKELVRHLYGIYRGGSNLPRQEEPDYTQSAGYLIPNRVTMAFRAYSSGL
jgi:uncharacterized phiE125 gp8 family phage protein